MATTVQATHVTAYPVQGQQVVVTNPTNRATMNVPAVRGLGVTQIVIGVLTIFLGIGTVAGFKYGYWVNASGSGIWFGIWILVTGVIGVMSAKSPEHRGLNGTNMGFNITCTVVSFFVGIFFAVALSYYANCSNYYRNYYSRYYFEPYCAEHKGAGTALYAILLILMIAEFFISLVASIYCCQGGCCAQQTTGVIIQAQQPAPTYIATSTTTGAITTSQYPGAPVVSAYPPQQITGYPPQYVQGGAYPPPGQPMQPGAYPAQQFGSVGGMAQTNITYSAGHPQEKMQPPPAYTAQ